MIASHLSEKILTKKGVSVSFPRQYPQWWRCCSACSSHSSPVWASLFRAELCTWTAALSMFTHMSCANITRQYDQMRWVWYIHTLKSTHKKGNGRNSQKLLKITLKKGHTAATCSILSVCKNNEQSSSTWTQILDCFHVCQLYCLLWLHTIPGMNETQHSWTVQAWHWSGWMVLGVHIGIWGSSSNLWLGVGNRSTLVKGNSLYFLGFYTASCCECKRSWK